MRLCFSTLARFRGQIFWKRKSGRRTGTMGATEREKRCETGLRRAAIVPSLLPTILPEYFQFISKSNNRSSFARNRENSKENRENPSLPPSLSDAPFFPRQIRICLRNGERERGKKREIAQREFQTGGEDGFTFLLICTYTYTLCTFINVYVYIYIYTNIRVYRILEVPTPSMR